MRQAHAQLLQSPHTREEATPSLTPKSAPEGGPPPSAHDLMQSPPPESQRTCIAAASVAGRDRSGRCTVWEKETRDRIKVLRMGPGHSRPLGSRALFLRATSLLLSVLASRKYLLCYEEVSLPCPQSHLPFY